LEANNNDGAVEGTLAYNSEYNCLELNGYELRSDDNIEINILKSWIPGRIAVDHGGWYLVTQDHVGIRLHSGLTARNSEQAAPESFAMQPAPTPPPLILLVDDDLSLLQALPRTISLRMPDARVDACKTAYEALQKLRERRYDAVVSDIKMPDMDGLTLLSHIREVQPMTPTLLITGHGDHEMAIRALRGGAYDYILKPIERDSFIAALLRAIQAHQLHRQVEDQQQALEQHARSLERVVQQCTQELIEADTVKDKIVSLVSQDLRAPLHRLRDMTHLLQRELQHSEVGQAVNRSFEDIEQSITSIEALTQELLATSQLEARTFLLQPQGCNLVDLCQNVLQEYTTSTTTQLSSELHKDIMPIELDTAQIRQVLMTLLRLANVQTTSDNAATSISLERVDHEAIIVLRDLDLHTDRKIELHVARNIVEQHHGRMEIQDVAQNRSAVFITLPLSNNIEEDEETSPCTYATWTLQQV
jgi:FixJ family two-component response regulator